MLQPRTYPELIGKALVLEAEPFAVMADDDNPWIEGLFFTVCLGVAVGLARFIGGLLLAASMPPAEAMREAYIMAARQAAAYSFVPAIDIQAVEAVLRQSWQWAAFFTGYGSGWERLLLLVFVPAALILIWLLYGLISYGAARQLGGTGTLNQTLGVTALIAAPQVLFLLTAIPFVSVGWLLIWVWALLIGFRGIEVAHDLSWQRSTLAALAAPAVFGLLLLASAIAIGLIMMIGGLA
jgi:hypothetical protein